MNCCNHIHILSRKHTSTQDDCSELVEEKRKKNATTMLIYIYVILIY